MKWFDVDWLKNAVFEIQSNEEVLWHKFSTVL
jgi:hypothetical protein